MDKKLYVAPEVKKVRLEIKNAVLAVCNSSPTYMSPKDIYNNRPCTAVPGCFDTTP